MKKIKIVNIAFIICFLIVLIIPLLTVNRIDGMLSKKENRYLAKFPKIINNDTKKINTNYNDEFQAWINDNIGLRDFFGKINTDINFKLLKTSPSNSVKIGRDGWYFYNCDSNLEIAYGQYPLTKEVLENIKNEQEKIQKALAERGIEYVLILTPSKVSIYPEELTGGDFTVRETPVDIVEKYLKENTTIKVINTKQALLEAKKEGKQVYNKTDTHWNEEGAYIGYKYINSKLNEWNIINDGPTNIKQVPDKFKGEFSSMMGDEALLPAENIKSTKIINAKAKEENNKELMDLFYYQQMNDNFGYNGNHIFKNRNKTGNKILMYGDSFFGKWKINELFAENTPELTFIWSDAVKGKVVDEIKPNVVMFERTERYITTLAKLVDPVLVYGELKNPSADITSDTTPKEVVKGKKYDIKITVKNTTNEIWNKQRNIRLCIFQNGYDYGYRIDIEEGKEIKPGEEYTFVLKDFQAPNTAESTYLEYQMVEEGIVYFGEKERKDIKIK